LDKKEIQENVQSLCGNASIDTLNVVFSNTPTFIKKIKLFQYKYSLRQGYKNDTVQEFMDLISVISTYKINSIDDIDKIDEIPKEYKDIIKEFYNKWIESEKAEQIINLANKFELNPLIVGIIVFSVVVIWGMAYGGVATLTANSALFYTMGICVIESLFFGIVSNAYIADSMVGNETKIYDALAEWVSNYLLPWMSFEFAEHLISGIMVILLTGLFLGILAGPLVLYYLGTESIWIARIVFLYGAQAWAVVPLLIDVIIGLVYLNSLQ